MGRAPKFFNFFMKMKLVTWLTKKFVGLVDIPLLSSPGLQSSLANENIMTFNLKRLQSLSARVRADHVLIVQDPFTTYYDAEVVRDLVLTIKKLGFQHW
jgi:Fe-S oxidoreductase